MNNRIISIYDRIAPKIADVYETQTHLSAIKQFSNKLKRDSKILDLGCGDGVDTIKFANLGFECIGIDASKGMISEAKKRHPKIEDKVLLMSALELKFPNDYFDAVWSWSVLTHFSKDEKEAVLQEIFRVLKSGGLFSQTIWHGQGAFVNKHIYPRKHFLLSTSSWKHLYKKVGFSTINFKLLNTNKKHRGSLRITAVKTT